MLITFIFYFKIEGRKSSEATIDEKRVARSRLEYTLILFCFTQWNNVHKIITVKRMI